MKFTDLFKKQSRVTNTAVENSEPTPERNAMNVQDNNVTENKTTENNSTENKAMENNSTENKTNSETMEQTKKETTDASTNDTVKVFNLIILDESGSMSAIYQEALTGVNETLQTIRMAKKEHPDQEHFVTLVAFDTGHYNQIYHLTSASMAKDITKEQYRPGGCTPLYDAMGRAINDLKRVAQQDDIVLVTIITDGYENASKEYTGHAIKALVEEMREKGWVFTYIGANQDVEKVAASMAINNHLAFEANFQGTNEMFARERISRGKFFEKASKFRKKEISKEELEDGYFDF